VDLNYTLYKGWLLSNLSNPLLRGTQCVYPFWLIQPQFPIEDHFHKAQA